MCWSKWWWTIGGPIVGLGAAGVAIAGLVRRSRAMTGVGLAVTAASLIGGSLIADRTGSMTTRNVKMSRAKYEELGYDKHDDRSYSSTTQGTLSTMGAFGGGGVAGTVADKLAKGLPTAARIGVSLLAATGGFIAGAYGGDVLAKAIDGVPN